jgi:hypothetical protein
VTSFVNDPKWLEAAMRRGALRDSAPQVPQCVPHHLPLGLCDECGSTVKLGLWAGGLTREELCTALLALVDLSLYRGPEKDALIREATARLSA